MLPRLWNPAGNRSSRYACPIRKTACGLRTGSVRVPRSTTASGLKLPSRLHDSTVTMKDTSLIYFSATLSHSLSMPIVGLLQFSLGLRGCAGLGAVLVACSTLLSSLATTVLGLAVLNGIFGIGVAFAYTCPLVSGYAWMPEHRGIVSGFVVAGFGAGAAVFNVVATAWVNPSDANPSPATGYYGKEIAMRVPGMYVILGVCYFALGMLGSWMIQPPAASFPRGTVAGGYASLVDEGTSAHSQQMVIGRTIYQNPGDAKRNRYILGSSDVGANIQEHKSVRRDDPETRVFDIGAPGCGRSQDGATNIMKMPDFNGLETAVQDRREDAPHTPRQFTPLEVLQDVNYYHLMLSMMLTAVSGLFIIGNYKRVAQDHFPRADHLLSILGSVGSLFNASGRVLGGLAIDRFGCFPTLLVMSLAFGGLLLALAALVAKKAAFFVIVCLLHLLYGSNFAIYPTLAADMFGAVTAGPNYGLVFMGFGVGSVLIMVWLSNVDETSMIFLSCGFLSLAGSVSVALHWLRWSSRDHGLK